MALRLMRVVGARPQFMQAAVLRRQVQARGHRELLVHTGQHYDHGMNEVFFRDLEIPPADINLNVGSASHAAQTARMLEGVERTLVENPCEAVIVDGDTNSTLAAALAAAKRHVPVVHVEAGLRSFDRRMPEEINRLGADHFGDLLCAPTETAMENLKREGLEDRAVLTGDLLYDCFLHYRPMARTAVLEQLELSRKDYAVVTVHRAENTDDGRVLGSLLSALDELPLRAIFPVHPRTKPRLERFLNERGGPRSLCPIPPVGYLDMLALVMNARCVLTDSGGVQREAFYAGVPSVILRNVTEWQEQLGSGWSVVVGSDPARIRDAFESLDQLCGQPPDAADVYGDGRAAARIVDLLEQQL